MVGREMLQRLTYPGAVPQKGMMVSVKPCTYTLNFGEILHSPAMDGQGNILCILSYMHTFIHLPHG
jgi:hypothetical protein